MEIRKNDDYFRWCCEWCDTENSVLWGEMTEELYCGACHKQAQDVLEPYNQMKAA